MVRTRLKAGDVTRLGGFFTQAIFLHGQDGREIERRVGYYAGRLRDGWALAYFLEVPRPDQFELRGYSQLSGGVERGHLPQNADQSNVEERVGARGGSALARTKEKLATQTFTLHGSKRLAKIIPLGQVDRSVDVAYPPGSGIPQWTMKTDMMLRARVVGRFEYEGSWTGGYA